MEAANPSRSLAVHRAFILRIAETKVGAVAPIERVGPETAVQDVSIRAT
jgi:hypothetical protein